MLFLIGEIMGRLLCKVVDATLERHEDYLVCIQRNTEIVRISKNPPEDG